MSSVETTMTTLNKKTPFPPESDTLLKYFTVIFCTLIFIVGILGNILVLIVFGSRWSKLKTCEMLMVSLACSDLIGSIIVPGKMLLENMEHSFHAIGDTGCKIVSFLSMTSITVSALTLVVISIDRFVIVRWPLRKRPELCTIVAVIVVTWLISSGVGFSYFVGDRIQLHHDKPVDIHVCRDFGSAETREKHIFIALFAQLFLPIVLISIIYPLIIIELQKSARNELFVHHQQAMRLRIKRNRKAAILLITIIIVFYVCVIPINAFYLLYMYGEHKMTFRLTIRIFTILQTIQMANNCANPIIYSKLHTSFRRTTLKLFCSCCIRRVRNYRWETFRNTLTTSFSVRSKRWSRSSSASNRDLLTSRKRSNPEDLNHNNKRQVDVKLADSSPTNVTAGTYYGEEQFSTKNHSPTFPKQPSDDDDEVFQSTSMIHQQDNLKQPLLKMNINKSRSSDRSTKDELIQNGVESSGEVFVLQEVPNNGSTINT